MSDASELGSAFDAALRQVDRALADGLRTRDGAPAADRLAALRTRLEAEREGALRRGSADPEWVRRIVREVAGWTPDTELALIAALGRIARAGGRPGAG